MKRLALIIAIFVAFSASFSFAGAKTTKKQNAVGSTVINTPLALSIPAAPTSAAAETNNPVILGTVTVNNPLALSIPAYSTGGGGGGGISVVTGTPPIVSTPITGGFNINCPTCGSATLNFATLSTAGPHTLAYDTVYWVNSPSDATLNFPDAASIPPGSQIVLILEGGTTGHVINAFTGGRFENDNRNWNYFKPSYVNGTAGNLSMYFVLLDPSKNLWRYSFSLPYQGSLGAQSLTKKV